MFLSKSSGLFELYMNDNKLCFMPQSDIQYQVTKVLRRCVVKFGQPLELLVGFIKLKSKMAAISLQDIF
jgi:hypothetical protein